MTSFGIAIAFDNVIGRLVLGPEKTKEVVFVKADIIDFFSFQISE